MTRTRKYKCTGCGIDRPCFVESNQEDDANRDFDVDELKCVFDETNQTSYNWEEDYAAQQAESQPDEVEQDMDSQFSWLSSKEPIRWEGEAEKQINQQKQK